MITKRNAVSSQHNFFSLPSQAVLSTVRTFYGGERVKFLFGCASISTLLSATFSLEFFLDLQLLAIIDQPYTDHINC